MAFWCISVPIVSLAILALYGFQGRYCELARLYVLYSAVMFVIGFVLLFLSVETAFFPKLSTYLLWCTIRFVFSYIGALPLMVGSVPL